MGEGGSMWTLFAHMETGDRDGVEKARERLSTRIGRPIKSWREFILEASNLINTTPDHQ